MKTPSTRAQVITRRTYNRPLDAEGKTFETWEQTVERVLSHRIGFGNGRKVPLCQTNSTMSFKS